jgi:hypothetical protein
MRVSDQGWQRCCRCEVRVVEFHRSNMMNHPAMCMDGVLKGVQRFDWNLELQRFSTRVSTYLALMDDRYPSTTDHQSVHLDYAYPDAERELNRWLPLVKWFLAIPHYIVLAFLNIAMVVVVIIAWFAILFTGHYPRGMFDFVEGVIRWNNRVLAYALVLVTDQYPPFRLSS